VVRPYPAGRLAPHLHAVSLQPESACTAVWGRPPLLTVRWPRPTGIASYLSEHVSLAVGRFRFAKPTDFVNASGASFDSPTGFPLLLVLFAPRVAAHDLRAPVAGARPKGRTDFTGVFMVRSRTPVVAQRYETPAA
jgi:hypothetical protein